MYDYLAQLQRECRFICDRNNSNCLLLRQFGCYVPELLNLHILRTMIVSCTPTRHSMHSDSRRIAELIPKLFGLASCKRVANEQSDVFIFDKARRRFGEQYVTTGAEV